MRRTSAHLLMMLLMAFAMGCGDENQPTNATDMGPRIRPDFGGSGGTAGSGGSAGSGGTAGTGGAAGTGGTAGTGAGGAGGSGGEPAIKLPYGQCPVDVTFSGQIQGPDSVSPNGGRLQTQPYPGERKGGLRAVLEQIPEPRANGEDPDSVDVDLPIQRVTVVATRPRVTPPNAEITANKGQFWIADADGTVEVYVDLERESAPGFDVRVGQTISFTARRLGRFGDKPQITIGLGWTLHEDVDAHATVFAREPNSALLPTDVPQIIRVTGLIDGEPTPCGGMAQCWNMTYGSGTARLRTTTQDLRPRTCVTFVGPVSSYQGEMQFDVVNQDWMTTYQRGNDIGEECSRDADCSSDVCITYGEEMVCSQECSQGSECPLGYRCEQEVCLPSGNGACPDEISFTGQVFEEGSIRPNGGQPRFEPYSEDYDTGLDVAIARVPPVIPGTNQTSLRLPVPLPVQRVTIVATGAFTEDDIPDSQRRIWVADGQGVVEMFLDDSSPPFVVKNGQVVSFDVNEVKRFGDKSQISEVQDWVLHTEADPQRPELPSGPVGEVYIFDPDRQLVDGDVHQVIRVTGTLEGQGRSCGGGNSCWLLNYGFGPSLIIRTKDPAARTGSCVTFVGPLGTYDGDLQLDTVNPSWLSVYN